MSKFSVDLNGHPEDLLREVGMSLNGLIRRLASEHGAVPLRKTFLRPETAEIEWIMDHVVTGVATAIRMMPDENREFKVIADYVRERHRKDIEEWIEENREKLAEIWFMRNDIGSIRLGRFRGPIR